MTRFAGLVGVERVQADAAARGLDIEVIERPAARSLEEAAGLLGIEPADIVKSLVVKRSDDTYVFALVPGGRKISWPKLRALLAVNKLQLPDASTVIRPAARSFWTRVRESSRRSARTASVLAPVRSGGTGRRRSSPAPLTPESA